MTMFGDFAIPAALASAEDYAAYASIDPGQVPANIDRVIAECTTIVLDATEGAIYNTDPDTGLATDSQIANALRDMTCAQALAWVKLGIDPDLAGVATATVRTSKKIGSASYTVADGDAAAASAARAAAQTGLVPSAFRIGRLNNLLGNQPLPYAL